MSMFTETTDAGKKTAPLQAPALNSTKLGGLVEAVGAIGAAIAGTFAAMNTTEWEVRVAIVAGVTLVIAVGLLGVVALIRDDSRTRLMGTTAQKAEAGPEEPADGGVPAGSSVWIAPPPMHVYSVADPEREQKVILVGMDKDKVVSYYVATPAGKTETLSAQEVHHVEVVEQPA